ncbi:hypothetical protein OAH59_03075 [Euryarchaeota archaeon]|nr:hypothetical protein [Euryarchaeota archaeon]
MTSNLARNFLAKHTICEIIWSTIYGNLGYFSSHGCQVANNHRIIFQVIV